MKNGEGFVVGKIVDVTDKEGQGRVRVRYPHLSDTLTEWASVASIMAGGGRGCFFMPEIDDEVLVAPQQGDWNHPFILGFVWNPVQMPPSEDPRQRMIRSKNGHTIRFVDSTPNAGNQGALVIEDPHGNKITMTDWGIDISSKGTINISAENIVIKGRPVRDLGGQI